MVITTTADLQCATEMLLVLSGHFIHPQLIAEAADFETEADKKLADATSNDVRFEVLNAVPAESHLRRLALGDIVTSGLSWQKIKPCIHPEPAAPPHISPLKLVLIWLRTHRGFTSFKKVKKIKAMMHVYRAHPILEEKQSILREIVSLL